MNLSATMQDEERALLILFIMAVLFLAFIFILIPASDSGEISAFDPISSAVGDRAYIQGDISSIYRTKSESHLMLFVGKNNTRVFICNECGADKIYSKVMIGDMIRVVGEVDEYQGELEIVVESADDITLIR